jgi:hypothetical protein
MKDAVLVLLLFLTLGVIFIATQTCSYGMLFLVGMSLFTFWFHGWPKIAGRLK